MCGILESSFCNCFSINASDYDALLIYFCCNSVVVQENSHVLEPDCGENGFIATITSEFPRGYCIETQINGKLLRGLVFFKNPSISGEFLTTIAGLVIYVLFC